MGGCLHNEPQRVSVGHVHQLRRPHDEPHLRSTDLLPPKPSQASADQGGLRSRRGLLLPSGYSTSEEVLISPLVVEATLGYRLGVYQVPTKIPRAGGRGTHTNDSGIVRKFDSINSQ